MLGTVNLAMNAGKELFNKSWRKLLLHKSQPRNLTLTSKLCPRPWEVGLVASIGILGPVGETLGIP